MANKKFEMPEIKIYEVKPCNVVATSGTGGGTGGGDWGAPDRYIDETEDFL